MVSHLGAIKSYNYIDVTIVRKAITLERAKKKRSYELICKKIKGEAKRLRATTIAIPKLEER